MPMFRSTGLAEDELLFQLLGIQVWDGTDDAAVLVGKEAKRPPDTEQALFVVLPDPNQPLAETERLAEILGRAVGLGKVQL